MIKIFFLDLNKTQLFNFIQQFDWRGVSETLSNKVSINEKSSNSSEVTWDSPTKKIFGGGLGWGPLMDEGGEGGSLVVGEQKCKRIFEIGS